MGVFLTQIGFTVGDVSQIASLANLSQAEELLGRLLRGGLANFRESDLSAWQLAAESASLTLGSFPAGPVDLVVYATDSFWGRDGHELDAARFLQAVGLERTPLIGAGLAGCANLAVALRSAAACVRGGDATTALVATTDVCQPEQRLFGGGIGVLSDGAATCIVSTRRPEQGLELLGVSMAVEAGLHTLVSSSERSTMAMAMATARGVQRATSELYKKTGLGPDDFSYLVSNNYIESTLEVFAKSAGIPFDRAYRETVADYAHCFAADVLINLATMTADGILQSGDRVLAIVAGYNSWACLALLVV